jgi:hypothetical protein
MSPLASWLMVTGVLWGGTWALYQLVRAADRSLNR